MGLEPVEKPGTLETDTVLVRTMRADDLEAVITTLRTRVDWDNFELLLAFFKREGFAPARRACLECRLDSTAPENYDRD